MRLYIRLLKNLVPYLGYIGLAVICMVVLSMTTGALAYLVGPVIKFLFTNQGEDVLKVVPFLPREGIDREEMILFVPIVVMVVALVKGLSFFGQAYLMGYVGQRIVADMRERLYHHIQSMPLSFFTKTPTGVLISRVTNDVNLLQSTVTDAFASLMRDTFTIIVLAGVALALDWRLALVAFVVFPLAITPMVKLGRKMRKVSKKSQTTMGSITSILQETFTGIKVVKAFCMEEYERRRFSRENRELFRMIMKSIKVKALSPPLMEFLGITGLALTIWYAGYRIGKGTLTPEGFVSFFAAVFMLYQPIKRLSGVNNTIQHGLAAAQRIFDLIDLSQRERERGGKVRIETLKEGIEFRGVSFAYEKDWVLKGIDLYVRRGEVLAIVGASGVGKTTFVNLIPRFYDVTEGRILIDGIDIRELDLTSLRSLISIVSQTTILFNDTVRNNIAYGDVTKGEDEIIEAAKAANAHDFIMSLPNGYDTIIGEQGVRLSGGQRQRLSIARALLKDAPILILDEATSSLDSESEREVQKALNRLMEGRTVFVIAHRLSTVRGADRIITLKDGRIVEMGTHEELLSKGGEYARLYNLQFFEPGVTGPCSLRG